MKYMRQAADQLIETTQNSNMKIAIPVINDNVINGHFGKSDKFNIYTINNGEIESVKTIPSFEGSGCKSGIAGVLAVEGVTKVLVSGIGGGSTNKLMASGIEIIRGCTGSPKENIERLVKGELTDGESTCDKHHGHDHKHEHSQSPKPDLSGEIRLARKNFRL
jgi:predicted Fe-Mo cluster-binding NifX family protein